MILFRAIRTISAECLKSKHLFKVSRHEGIHFLTIRNFTFIQPFLSTTKFVWCVRYNSICARLFRTFESSPQSRCWYRVNEVHSWFSLKLRVWLQFAFLSFFNSVLTTHFCVLWFTKKHSDFTFSLMQSDSPSLSVEFSRLVSKVCVMVILQHPTYIIESMRVDALYKKCKLRSRKIRASSEKIRIMQITFRLRCLHATFKFAFFFSCSLLDNSLDRRVNIDTKSSTFSHESYDRHTSARMSSCCLLPAQISWHFSVNRTD